MKTTIQMADKAPVCLQCLKLVRKKASVSNCSELLMPFIFHFLNLIELVLLASIAMISSAGCSLT